MQEVEANGKDQILVENSRIYKAIVRYRSGDVKNAKDLLHAFVKEQPDSKWKPTILYFLTKFCLT